MSKRSRKGHPERSGDQQQLREKMFDVFEFIDKARHPYLWDELFDTLYDESQARGMNHMMDLFALGDDLPRHGGQS